MYESSDRAAKSFMQGMVLLIVWLGCIVAGAELTALGRGNQSSSIFIAGITLLVFGLAFVLIFSVMLLYVAITSPSPEEEERRENQISPVVSSISI
jgi:protein-S-isoprenylcysteine O-methyltransferase Ste14